MKSPTNRSGNNDVYRLSAALETHLVSVSEIPGVTGWGIGESVRSESDQIVIQIFVNSEAIVDQVQEIASEIFKDYPVETNYQPILDAG